MLARAVKDWVETLGRRVKDQNRPCPKKYISCGCGYLQCLRDNRVLAFAPNHNRCQRWYVRFRNDKPLNQRLEGVSSKGIRHDQVPIRGVKAVVEESFRRRIGFKDQSEVINRDS